MTSISALARAFSASVRRRRQLSSSTVLPGVLHGNRATESRGAEVGRWGGPGFAVALDRGFALALVMLRVAPASVPPEQPARRTTRSNASPVARTSGVSHSLSLVPAGDDAAVGLRGVDRNERLTPLRRRRDAPSASWSAAGDPRHVRGPGGA